MVTDHIQACHIGPRSALGIICLNSDFLGFFLDITFPTFFYLPENGLINFSANACNMLRIFIWPKTVK